MEEGWQCSLNSRYEEEAPPWRQGHTTDHKRNGVRAAFIASGRLNPASQSRHRVRSSRTDT